ncbi:uncharacterized protein KY384_008626 [Bacidia gigantensis]|uniref:uncharacterized protein n=1 Tax=Bacidia gigantensis TaxID=2732470 RepID=UPI001D0580E6|nr:uncharacterized protein KY384_008626 [Bacidia gigantensis]KAG8527196.1 hypothetical protein KY384_008626 [Bacidia gigantensis]
MENFIKSSEAIPPTPHSLYSGQYQHPGIEKRPMNMAYPETIEMTNLSTAQAGNGPPHEDNANGLRNRLLPDPFANNTLARQLKRHHITGIAFSAAVGIGLFQTSGQIITVGGSVGALVAFLFAGLVILSVMRSLAELISVRPVPDALTDFPSVFVDEALGFAVGVVYWRVE